MNTTSITHLSLKALLAVSLISTTAHSAPYRNFGMPGRHGNGAPAAFNGGAAFGAARQPAFAPNAAYRRGPVAVTQPVAFAQPALRTRTPAIAYAPANVVVNQAVGRRGFNGGAYAAGPGRGYGGQRRAMAAVGYGIGAFASAYGAALEQAAAPVEPQYIAPQPEVDVLPAVMGILANSAGNWQYRQGYHHHHHYGMAPMFYR